MTKDILTLSELLIAAATAAPTSDAIVFPESRASYQDLYANARQWGKAFISLGVKPGDNIAILMTTQPEFVDVMFGASLIGACTVPINARYAPEELVYLMENGDIVTLVTTDKVADAVDFVARLNTAFPDLANSQDAQHLKISAAPRLQNIVITGTTEPTGFINASRIPDLAGAVDDATLDARIAQVKPSDLALILYTSGTTSKPKGCMIKHEAIVSNSRALGRGRYQMTASDRFWSPLPIFHIAGILPLVAVMDVMGAYLTIPHFDAGIALSMLENEGATMTYPSFVTIMQDLINHPNFSKTDLSKVRLMNSNLGVQPPAIKEKILAAMPHTVQVGSFGMTEASGTVCTSRIDDPEAVRVSRLGVPLDGWELKIINPETEALCGVDEQGEIFIRGRGMLSGYYRYPVKTAEAIDAEGWFHTGDIGSLDAQGQIMFHGRLKDMLKVGGENVAAAEIEDVLNSHPAVELAQVVGIPDARYEEVPAAFIKLSTGASLTEEEALAHCQGKLARFKIPRFVRFVNEWPMSTSKVQKFKLRDLLVEELNAK